MPLFFIWIKNYTLPKQSLEGLNKWAQSADGITVYGLFLQRAQAPAIFSDIAFILTALSSYLRHSKFTVSAGIGNPIFPKKGENPKVHLEKLEAWIRSFWRVAETRLDVVEWQRLNGLFGDSHRGKELDQLLCNPSTTAQIMDRYWEMRFPPPQGHGDIFNTWKGELDESIPEGLFLG